MLCNSLSGMFPNLPGYFYKSPVTSPDIFRKSRKIFVSGLKRATGDKVCLPYQVLRAGMVHTHPNPGPIWPPIAPSQIRKKPVSGSVPKYAQISRISAIGQNKRFKYCDFKDRSQARMGFRLYMKIMAVAGLLWPANGPCIEANLGLFWQMETYMGTEFLAGYSTTVKTQVRVRPFAVENSREAPVEKLE